MVGSEVTFERRKSPRVELRGLIGLPTTAGAARIVDISAHGAQVEFPSRLMPGNVYEMKLTFPDRTIKARVRVTRSIDLKRPDSDGDHQVQASCLAGLEFQNLAQADQRYLERYVAGMSASPRN